MRPDKVERKLISAAWYAKCPYAFLRQYRHYWHMPRRTATVSHHILATFPCNIRLPPFCRWPSTDHGQYERHLRVLCAALAYITLLLSRKPLKNKGSKKTGTDADTGCGSRGSPRAWWQQHVICVCCWHSGESKMTSIIRNSDIGLDLT